MGKGTQNVFTMLFNKSFLLSTLFFVCNLFNTSANTPVAGIGAGGGYTIIMDDHVMGVVANNEEDDIFEVFVVDGNETVASATGSGPSCEVDIEHLTTGYYDVHIFAELGSEVIRVFVK